MLLQNDNANEKEQFTFAGIMSYSYTWFIINLLSNGYDGWRVTRKDQKAVDDVRCSDFQVA